jgi:flagellar biosynthesis/type III secretory pathway protein FliH
MTLIKGDPARLGGVALNLGDLQVQAERLIEETRARVADMVRVGHGEAQRIMDGAAATGREDGFEDGRAEGRAAGMEQGRAEALAEYREKLDAIAGRWSTAVDDWEGARSTMLRTAEVDMLTLAIALAERIVYRQIECDPSVVVDQLRQIVNDLTKPSRVDVLIHPDDRSLIEEALPSVVAVIDSAAQVTVRDDASIDRGGCMVRTGRGMIDARMRTQLRRVAEALLPHGDAERADTDQAMDS